MNEGKNQFNFAIVNPKPSVGRYNMSVMMISEQMLRNVYGFSFHKLHNQMPKIAIANISVAVSNTSISINVSTTFEQMASLRRFFTKNGQLKFDERFINFPISSKLFGCFSVEPFSLVEAKVH